MSSSHLSRARYVARRAWRCAPLGVPRRVPPGRGQAGAPTASPISPPSCCRRSSTSRPPRRSSRRAALAAERPAGPDLPQFPPGSPFEEFFKDFFNRNRKAAATGESLPRARHLARLGLHHRSGGPRRHQQPRDRRCRRDHRDPPGRHQSQGRGGRPRHQDRHGAVARSRPTKPLPRVKFGDSDQTRVGDWVLAIGNPFGLGGTVTAGILSARAREINSGPYDDFLQTDAVDQPRQFRRADVQHGWRGDRHQHRDLFALGRLDRHRLRDPLQPGRGRWSSRSSEYGHAAARLARRPHPERHRRDRREPRPRQAARRAHRQRQRWRPGAGRGHPARRRRPDLRRQGGDRTCAICRASSPRRRSTRRSR